MPLVLHPKLHPKTSKKNNPHLNKHPKNMICVYCYDGFIVWYRFFWSQSSLECVNFLGALWGHLMGTPWKQIYSKNRTPPQFSFTKWVPRPWLDWKFQYCGQFFWQTSFCQKKCYVKNCFLRVIPTLTHYSDIVSDIPSGRIFILLPIYCPSSLFWHSIWHSFWHFIWLLFWHSFWHIMCLAYLHDILSGILSGISSEILCAWGPAGEHSDPQLAVEVRRGTLWHEVAVRVPGGNTAI